MHIMIGICGDNCEYCPRYLATQSSSKIELEKVKDLWIRLGLRNKEFSVEDMVCHGCRPENRCAYQELYDCVKTKGLKNCGLCDDYPCKLMTTAFNKSDRLKTKAMRVCESAEMEILQKAFFSKKEYFDNIYHRMKNKR